MFFMRDDFMLFAGGSRLLSQLAFEVFRGLRDVFRLAHVAPVIFIGWESEDLFSVRRQTQVRRYDRESSLFRQQFKQARRDDVDS